MPDLSLKGVRRPDLRLPEVSRDDIGRAIEDVRRDVDLSRFDPRKFDMPTIDLSKVDVPAAVTSAAQAVGVVKRPRSRVPFVVGGLIVTGLIAWVAANSPAIRPRIDAAIARARTAIQARRDAMHDDEGPSTEPRAFDAAVAAPIDQGSFTSDAPTNGSPFDGGADLPDGFGADVKRLDPATSVADGGSRS